MSYDWWQRALAGEEVGGPTLPVHDGDCQEGFWRCRVSRGGPFIPAATWIENGAMVCLVNGQEVDAAEQWSRICRYPVTEGAYRAKMAGEPWPDEDQAMAASLEPPARGHNNPPTDPWQILHEQIEAALKGVQDYTKITSDEAVAKAQGLRSRLLELSNKADKEREKVTKPLVAEQRRVNGLWQPIIGDAKNGADQLRAAMSRYETEKETVRRAAEAERLRNEAEARKTAEEAGKPAPEPVQPAPAPEPVQTKVRGAYGRAATKKMVKVATVSDQDALYPFLKTHKELIELMAKLAQRAVDAGMNPPGVTVEERIDVR